MGEEVVLVWLVSVGDDDKANLATSDVHLLNKTSSPRSVGDSLQDTAPGLGADTERDIPFCSQEAGNV